MKDVIDIAAIEDNRMLIDGLRAWAAAQPGIRLTAVTPRPSTSRRVCRFTPSSTSPSGFAPTAYRDPAGARPPDWRPGGIRPAGAPPTWAMTGQ